MIEHTFVHMPKKRSPYCTCLYFSSNAIARALTKMAEEEFAQTGMSPSHGFILMTVNKQPGIFAGDLAKAMELTPSTVTRLLEKLEQKNLIERKSEGKYTRIFATDEGRQQQYTLENSWKRLGDRYGNIIGREKGQHLSAYLTEALMSIQED